MTMFDENMVLGIECPQCGREFEETLGKLLREDYACPMCGVPLDTGDFRKVFGEVNDTDDGTMDAGDMTKTNL